MNRRYALILALPLLVAASPASAQGGADVGVGYQYLHAPEQEYPVGVNLDVSARLSDQIRLVGEVGWARDSDPEFVSDGDYTATHYGGGVRWVSDTPGYAPYLQVILGGHRDSLNVDVIGEGFADVSETNLMIQPGAGVLFPVGASWGLFGQADYRHIFYDGYGQNDYRFVVGLRFGR